MNIKELKEIAKCRKIFIWGASNMGGAVLNALTKNGIEVEGFIDNSDLICGKSINGHMTYDSKILEQYQSKEKAYIVISTNVISESLKKQCEQAGYIEKDDFDVIDNQYTVMCEISGACNLRCPSCARGNYLADSGIDKGFISIADFKELVQKVKREMPELIAITLFNWGEPFLHPHLDEIIEICNDHKLFSILSSNLSVELNLDNILKKNPGWLKVSLSGYSAEIYNTTHTGGNIDLVKSNLYRIKYLIDKYNLDTIVEVGYHLYKNNQDEEQMKMKELIEELGFIFRPAIAGNTSIEIMYDRDNGKVITSQCDELYIDSGLSYLYKPTDTRIVKDCRYIKDHIAINHDGTMFPCCKAFKKENLLKGINFKENTLEEILKSKENLDLCKWCISKEWHMSI